MHQDDTDARGVAGIIRYLLRWFVAPPDDIEITFVDRLTTFISRVAMVLTAVIVVIMTFEVTMRYAFFSPTLWVNEMSVFVRGLTNAFRFDKPGIGQRREYTNSKRQSEIRRSEIA